MLPMQPIRRRRTAGLALSVLLLGVNTPGCNDGIPKGPSIFPETLNTEGPTTVTSARNFINQRQEHLLAAANALEACISTHADNLPRFAQTPEHQDHLKSISYLGSEQERSTKEIIASLLDGPEGAYLSEQDAEYLRRLGEQMQRTIETRMDILESRLDSMCTNKTAARDLLHRATFLLRSIDALYDLSRADFRMLAHNIATKLRQSASQRSWTEWKKLANDNWGQNDWTLAATAIEASTNDVIRSFLKRNGRHASQGLLDYCSLITKQELLCPDGMILTALQDSGCNRLLQDPLYSIFLRPELAYLSQSLNEFLPQPEEAISNESSESTKVDDSH